MIRIRVFPLIAAAILLLCRYGWTQVPTPTPMPTRLGETHTGVYYIIDLLRLTGAWR